MTLWREWAVFENGMDEPYTVISANWREIDAALEGTRSQSFYTMGQADALNALLVRPVTRSGAPLDEWQVRDEGGDTVEAQASTHGAGEVLHITEAWSDMPLADAQAKAETDLGVYFVSYRTSEFPENGHVYPASRDASNLYRDYAIMQGKETEPLGFIVRSKDGDLRTIDDNTDWNAFWNAYANLVQAAAAHTATALGSVEGAATTDDIRTIMAGLPEIPGTQA